MRESAYQHSLNQVPKMKEICSHLAIFGVEFFHYVRVYKNGQYFSLSNSENLTKDLALNLNDAHIFNGKLLFCISDIKFYLWSDIPNTEMETLFAKTCWHGLNSMRTTPHYVEFWGFATSMDNGRMQNIYMKHINSFAHFIQVFNRSLEYDFQIGLTIDTNKLRFINVDLTSPWEIEENKAKRLDLSFFHSLYPKGVEVTSKNGKVRISNRELDCLRLIRQGKRVKEIAAELQISNRTVDKFMANIHNKTGYNCNSQLVQLYDDQIAEILNILKGDSGSF